MIIGGVIAGIVLIYLGISAYFIGHFYVNTQINGKDFSGKNAEAVKKYIKEQVDGYELKIIEQNQQTDVIRGTDISLEYKENPSRKHWTDRIRCSGRKHFSPRVQRMLLWR